MPAEEEGRELVGGTGKGTSAKLKTSVMMVFQVFYSLATQAQTETGPEVYKDQVGGGREAVSRSLQTMS